MRKRQSRAKRRITKNKYNRLQPGKTAESIIRRNFEKFLPRNCNSVPKKSKNPESVSAQNSGDDINLIAQVFGKSCHESRRHKEEEPFTQYKEAIGILDEVEKRGDQEAGPKAEIGSPQKPERSRRKLKPEAPQDPYKRLEGESLEAFRKRMKEKARKATGTKILTERQIQRKAEWKEKKQNKKAAKALELEKDKEMRQRLGTKEKVPFGEVVQEPPQNLAKLKARMAAKLKKKIKPSS